MALDKEKLWEFMNGKVNCEHCQLGTIVPYSHEWPGGRIWKCTAINGEHGLAYCGEHNGYPRWRKRVK